MSDKSMENMEALLKTLKELKQAELRNKGEDQAQDNGNIIDD